MVLPALLLGLGSFGRRASEHSGWATRVLGTGAIPSVPRDLKNDRWGGREMNIDHRMDEA